MRSDVHSAALRAAAKVAFSVAFLGGCGGAVSTGLTDEDPLAKGKDKGGSEPATDDSSPAPPASTPAATTPSPPAHGKDASTPTPLACEQIINAAFPVDGDYPGTNQNVSVEVQDCCLDALTSGQNMKAHTWDCCANIPDSSDARQRTTIACTPWGPPVPPAMKRRSKAIGPTPDACAVAVGVA